MTNSPIMVFVSNSATTIMRTLSFVDGFASIETDSYSAPFDATTLDINVQSNLDYTIEIPSSASSWISVKSVTTRAAVRNDVITLAIAENTEASARTATIELLYDDTTVGSIEIYQQSQIIAYNEIAYTTTDGKVANLTVADALGSNIISNSYNNGRGLIVCENEISTIGASAFNSCSNLQTIKLPDSTTVIDTDSFRNCRSLTSVTIPDNVTEIGSYAFYLCSSLKSVTIGNSVTSIGNYAFRNCTSLTSVTIPDSVTSIGHSAFNQCRSLTSVTIPDSVTSIGNYAFYYCSSLTSVTIPDSVTSIGGSAFEDCTSLRSITIPDSVTSIGEYAFSGCTGELIVNCNICGYKNGESVYGTDILNGCSPFYNSKFEKITIGNSVTSIGYGAFYGCSSLASVHIPDLSAWCKISFGGSSANPLYYAKKLHLNGSELTDITIPSDITEIKDYAFRGCTSLTSVTIPDSVTSIGSYAFYNCRSLTSVTIPDSVTSIGNGAFHGCTSLTSVTIPDSVTSIGNGAFHGCTSLTSVTIPDSVTSIGSSAFSGCSSLTSVYCKPTTPPIGGSGMFNKNATDRKIYVPIGSGEAYRTAEYWSEYADCIEEKEF